MISCGGGPAGNGFGTFVCLPLFLAYMVEHWRGGPTCGRKADIGAMQKVDSRTIAFMVGDCSSKCGIYVEKRRTDLTRNFSLFILATPCHCSVEVVHSLRSP